MPAVQLFDSQECAWADMEVMFSGAPLTKIRGVNYTIDSNDEELFAGGDEAISIQSGNISKSGTLKMLKGAIDDINRAAVIAGGRFAPDIRFDLVITYLATIGGVQQIDTLIGCKINKLPKGWEQGATHMDCECPFKFLRIRSL